MEYPKIETLYERDKETFKVKPGIFKNKVYDLIKTWQWTEKVDGMNIRLIWTSEKKLAIAGRTDNAQIPGDLVSKLVTRELEAKLTEIFNITSVVLYGEGYGGSIQKMSKVYGTEKKFILFDVLVDGKWWLNWDGVLDVASKLGLETVPSYGELILEHAGDLVRPGLASKVGTGPAEGLVGRTSEPLFDNRGQRLIVKLKTKDF